MDSCISPRDRYLYDNGHLRNTDTTLCPFGVGIWEVQLNHFVM